MYWIREFINSKYKFLWLIQDSKKIKKILDNSKIRKVFFFIYINAYIL